MEKIDNPQEIYFSKMGMDTVLVILNDEVVNPKWNREPHDVGVDETITLEDIQKQFPYPGLLVIAESPLSGAIYRCGNYSDMAWWQVGTMAGYA